MRIIEQLKLWSLKNFSTFTVFRIVYMNLYTAAYIHVWAISSSIFFSFFPCHLTKEYVMN